jgi:hypothetical protein
MPTGKISKERPYTPRRGRFAGRTFTSWSAYKNALARSEGFHSHEARRRRPRPVAGREDLFGRRSAERGAHERVLEALNLMREHDYSLSKAARVAATTPGTVLHHVGRQGVRKTASGRYRATKSDSLYRRMWVTGTEGRAGYMDVRGSREARLVARHDNAIRRYLATGRREHLRRFVGRNAAGLELETDPDELVRRYEVGDLDFDQIYEPL